MALEPKQNVFGPILRSFRQIAGRFYMRNQFGILERKVNNYSHSLAGTVGILAHYLALDSPNHFFCKSPTGKPTCNCM